MKLKRTTYSKAQAIADRALSRYLKAKYGNNCQIHILGAKTGHKLPFRCSEKKNCCHKYSRKAKAIRYDLRNVYWGCASGNTWAYYNPVDWYKLWRRLWDEDVEYLDLREKLLCQRKVHDLLWIAEDYNNKTKELERE